MLGRYLVRRILSGMVVLWALVVLVFLAAYVIGDPVDLQATSELLTPADLAEMRHALGYDRPLPEQFVDFVSDLLRGDLGVSVSHSRPALDVLMERLPATLLLAGTAIAITIVFALPLALLAARRPGTPVETAIQAVSTALASLPSFWFGLAMIFVFAVRISWLPTGGYGGVRELLMPAIALAALPLGHTTLVLSAALRTEFSQQYVTVARAKGLSERVIATRHVLRNASLVFATQIGFLVVLLLNGTVLIETVFAWPGIGSLGLAAVHARDLPLVMATVIYIGLIVTIVNLVVDVAYARLDPRVRLS